MENSLLINRLDPVEQFCISFITMNVVDVGLQRVLASWNSHSIEGLFLLSQQSLKIMSLRLPIYFYTGKNDRIPNFVASNTNSLNPVNGASVPTSDEVLCLYTEAGGHITTDCHFGIDPLAGDDILIRRRDEEFAQNNHSFTEIFNNVVNGNDLFLEQAVRHFILLTRSLSST